MTFEELSPGTKQGHHNKQQSSSSDGFTNHHYKRSSLYNIATQLVGMSKDSNSETTCATGHRKAVASISPVEQVAPWVLREDADTMLYAGRPPVGDFYKQQHEEDDEDDAMTLHDLKMKMSIPLKKVAPLRTHGLLPGKDSLPILANTPHDETHSRGNGNSSHGDASSSSSFSSPPPPMPLPKSGQSDTMGCADLPPPPPPSHSPDHKYRIQSLLSRKRAPQQQQQQHHHQQYQHWSDIPLPPVPQEGGVTSPMAPTPISKGMSSASSYPTVSDSALPPSARIRSMSPPYPNTSSSSRLPRMAGRLFLRDSGSRPRSAGAGESAARGSIRSPLSIAPSSVGAKGTKNSFIVFSVNRGSAIDPRASFMTQETQPPSHQQQQEQSRQHSAMTSPSVYSNNAESVFVTGPAPIANDDDAFSPGLRASNISSYLDAMMIPTAPKTAAAREKETLAKSHYRRSSSFEGLSRPRKESLRQDTNQPNWFKWTRDRQKKKLTELESEEKIVEAEREIYDEEEQEEEEEVECSENASYYQEDRQQKGLGHEHWPSSGSIGGADASSARSSPLYQRQRCLSDQPYAGMLSLSPATMSPRSPPPRF